MLTGTGGASADVSWPTHLDPATGSRSYLRDYALSTLVPVRGEGGSMSICRTLNQGATTRRKRKGQNLVDNLEKAKRRPCPFGAPHARLEQDIKQFAPELERSTALLRTAGEQP